MTFSEGKIDLTPQLSGDDTYLVVRAGGVNRGEKRGNQVIAEGEKERV